MKLNKKGISPIIATVLLIAFTVSVAGILITWLSGFTQSTTQTVGSTSTTLVVCSQGQVNVGSLVFSNGSLTLSGLIQNQGQIALGNISVNVIYTNATSQKINLCGPNSLATSCSVSNLTLNIADQATFNVSISSNYNTIRVATNCSGVYSTASASDIVVKS